LNIVVSHPWVIIVVGKSPLRGYALFKKDVSRLFEQSIRHYPLCGGHPRNAPAHNDVGCTTGNGDRVHGLIDKVSTRRWITFGIWCIFCWIAEFAVIFLTDAVTTVRSEFFASRHTTAISAVIFTIIADFTTQVIDDTVAATRREIIASEAAATIGTVVRPIVADFAQGR
jgi:hypothetical protein